VLLLFGHEALQRAEVLVPGPGEIGRLEEVRAVARFPELEDGKRLS
jgi:hypothetical protein